LPGQRPAIGDEPFQDYAFHVTFTDDAQLQVDSEHLTERSEHLQKSSEHLEHLRSITLEMQAKKRVPKDVMTKAILGICAEFRSLRELSQILSRKTDSLRVHYLNKLVAEGKLDLKYPDKPNHPSQQYKTRSDSSTE
jgi:ATP-dependent DNA helicase RecG